LFDLNGRFCSFDDCIALTYDRCSAPILLLAGWAKSLAGIKLQYSNGQLEISDRRDNGCWQF